jgi:hypothetical protein
LSYFRNTLGIEEGLWGLFAVPIRGRVGYQCSNFYRQLIKDQKVEDDRYEILPDGKLRFRATSSVIPPSVIEILEKEAYAFIDECMCREDGEVPQIQAPVWVDRDRSHTKQSPAVKPAEELMNLFGRERRLPERRYNPLRDETPGHGKGGYLCKGRDIIAEDEDLRCPLYGVLDPLSDDPMLTPMIDRGGYVMDLKSWRKVFRSGITPPFPSEASCEDDLEALTSKNYGDLKFYIVNMPC